MTMTPTSPPRHGVRYRLGLAAGDVAWLEVSTAAASNDTHAVAQALALEPAMPLLSALEAWLGAPFAQLAPDATASPWPGAEQALSLLADGIARVALPWHVLRVGQALDVPGCTLQWPAMDCDLLFESIADDRIQPHELAPGSVVLLPGTLPPTGIPVAVIARAGHRAWPRLMGLQWDPRQDRLRLASPQLQTAASADASWEVVAAAPCALSAACWFGAADRATPDLPPPRVLALRCKGETLATGRPVPVGPGMGLLIEDAREAAALTVA